jgi:hypothetical protein
VARPGYGWVEWVDHEACGDANEVVRFYERAGMLLCLVYALAGTDCHRDNLIAEGEHLVLIDAESLMHPRPSLEGRQTGLRQAANDELVTGILGTGLLPSWQVNDDAGGKQVFDISGLNTAHEKELIVDAPRWDRINSDAMAPAFGPARIPLPKSQPLLPGEPVRLENHADQLLAGFERFRSGGIALHQFAIFGSGAARIVEVQGAEVAGELQGATADLVNAVGIVVAQGEEKGAGLDQRGLVVPGEREITRLLEPRGGATARDPREARWPPAERAGLVWANIRILLCLVVHRSC